MSRHKHRSKSTDKYDSNSMNINPELLKMLGLGEFDNENIAQIMSSIREENFNIDSMNSILKNLGSTNIDDNVSGFSDMPNLANMLASSMQSNKGNNNISSILANLMSGGIDPSLIAQNMGMNFNWNGNDNRNNIFNSRNGLNANINNDNFKENKSQGKVNIKNNITGNLKQRSGGITDSDDKLRMLSSLKNFVDEDKIRFLDRVIEMYKNGEIIYR